MRILYGLGIRCLYGLMWLASFFHAKAHKWIFGRKIRFQSFPIPSDRQVVWFHCASLGEFDQGLPVMNALKAAHPEVFLVVTFFSPSGMEFYDKRTHSVDLALYLPLDTKRNAAAFVRHIHPDSVFFVKYEFWYNHLKAARRSGARIYGVSSLFRPSHRFFQWYGGFFRKALRLFDHFYTQDQRSADLLKSIGIDQVTVTGDTRYDRMLAVKDRNEANAVLEAFKGEEPIVLLGSSWTVDEETLLPALLQLKDRFKLIIAPHDVSETHMVALMALFDQRVTRYTQYDGTPQRVLILDTIGQLTSAYRYADIAYVGGGFTGKLHNILEPGAFGIPIVFGPHYERFPEAQLFLERGVASSITTAADFLAAVEYGEANRATIAVTLTQIFSENAGAAQRVIAATVPV